MAAHYAGIRPQHVGEARKPRATLHREVRVLQAEPTLHLPTHAEGLFLHRLLEGCAANLRAAPVSWFPEVTLDGLLIGQCVTSEGCELYVEGPGAVWD